MTTFFVSRLLQCMLVAFGRGVLTVVFFVGTTGDPVHTSFGANATPTDIARISPAHGL